MVFARGAVVLLALLTLLLVGCRTAPIYNVDRSPVPSSAGLTVKQVGNVIEGVAVETGWSIERKTPGQMVGTLRLRRHLAIVNITYDAKQFSIQYKDSRVLKYDGEKIHRNYNNWIHKLQRRITARLVTPL